jgi:hypothetical protein
MSEWPFYKKLMSNNNFSKTRNQLLSKDTRTFLKHYLEHIETILRMPSGKHDVDKKLLKKWIEAQASERRRVAAKALADNIIYITHAKLVGRCKDLVDDIYTDKRNAIPEENKLKWFVGQNDKSSYFISIICYHIAIQKGYRLPDEILIEFDHKDCANSTILFFDDMSYTGSQASQLLKNIYIDEVCSELKPTGRTLLTLDMARDIPFSDIRVCMCYMTQHAHDYLETIHWSHSDRATKRRPIYWEGGATRPNPYKIYKPEIIPNIQEILGDQLYTDCIIFFNPYRRSQCICYFDHKIADSASTFLNVLRFGQVPPSKIDYEFIYDAAGRYSPLSKYYSQEEETVDKDIAVTEFIPFVDGCRLAEKEKTELQKLPYHVFMLTSGGTDPNTGKNSTYDLYAIDDSEPIFKFKNSVELRCPVSWYKHGFFKGGFLKKSRLSRRITRKNRK